MATNLHKDLDDAQIHVPKGFTAAANNTKLTKDSSGVLTWAVDDHPVDNVTKIIAGTNVTISPTTGLGDVTINSTGGGGTSDPHAVMSLRGCFNYEGSGERSSGNDNWFVRGLRCAREEREWNELGFTQNLGNNTIAPITGIPVPVIMSGALHFVDSTNPNLASFQGIIYSTESVICEFGFGVFSPNCATPTEGGGDLHIAAETISSHTILKNQYQCFNIAPAGFSFLQSQIIVPIIRCTTEAAALLIVNGTLRLIQP